MSSIDTRYYHCAIMLGVCLALTGISNIAEEMPERHEFSSYHMGTEFRIALYTANSATAEAAADSAFRRVEELNQILSDYIDDSELNRLAATSGSGKEVSVSDPLFVNIAKARNVAQKTGGAFDITIGPYVEIWREVRQNPEPQLPDSARLKEASESVGYEKMKLNEDEQTVKLKAPDMQLDPGGIAKGYAVDEALAVLQHFGIQSALVDGGGDIVFSEAPPEREGWDIQIYSEHPEYEKEPLILSLSNRAVTTSGDLFQFVEIGGTRYSHIIDPETGTALTDRRQATVVGEKGITVDAYATAFTVLPPSESLQIAASIDEIAAYIEVNKTDSIATFESSGFKELKRQN